MIKVAVIVGTRPEAIKMAPVYLELRANPAFDVEIIATAQHRTMLDQVFRVFDITPEIDLNVMELNQDLTGLTARILSLVQPELRRICPDVVLVHGDTTTCLASALAAFYEGIPIGHVEAGLRTHDMSTPWPEEMNRRLVDPLCRWCFAPTQRAQSNLISENIPVENIEVTGNTIVDALEIVRKVASAQSQELDGLEIQDTHHRKMILVTGHRRESFGRPFEEFCLALKELALLNANVSIVYPVHLNPKVQGPVREILSGVDRIHLIPPLEYLTFIQLLESCFLVVTDSGGVQEEAPSFGKPVLVTREITERPEAIEAGLAKLVGTSKQSIIEEVSTLLHDSEAYSAMTSNINPYGDGMASNRIVNALSRDLGV